MHSKETSTRCHWAISPSIAICSLTSGAAAAALHSLRYFSGETKQQRNAEGEMAFSSGFFNAIRQQPRKTFPRASIF